MTDKIEKLANDEIAVIVWPYGAGQKQIGLCFDGEENPSAIFALPAERAFLLREAIFGEALRAEVASLRQQLDEARARANEAARLSADARDRADWLAKEYQTLSEFAGILERDRSARDKWGLDLAARHGISEGMTDPWGDILGVYGMIAEHIDALNARVAAAEAARDLLFSELAEARRELRDGLSDRDLLTDVPPDQLVDEVLALIDRGYQQYTELRSSYVDLFANESRLLDVYRAAEAWARVWRDVDEKYIESVDRALIAAVDAYRSATPAEPGAVWTPAKDGDTPGERCCS